MKLFHLGHEEMFTLNRPINHLIKAGGRDAGLLANSIASRQLRFWRSLDGRSLYRRSLSW
jgi:hypothetical protein